MRANETGGDEVSALARTFNRDGGRLCRRAPRRSRIGPRAPAAARRRLARADDAAVGDPRLRRNARDAGVEARRCDAASAIWRSPTRKRTSSKRSSGTCSTWRGSRGAARRSKRASAGGRSVPPRRRPSSARALRARLTRNSDDGARAPRTSRRGCRSARAGAAERRRQRHPSHAGRRQGLTLAPSRHGDRVRITVRRHGPGHSRPSTCRTSSIGSTRRIGAGTHRRQRARPVDRPGDPPAPRRQREGGECARRRRRVQDRASAKSGSAAADLAGAASQRRNDICLARVLAAHPGVITVVF